MSGESVPFVLPFSRAGRKHSEASALYKELRKPLLRYLVCLGLSSDEAQDVVQDAFVSLQRHLVAGGSKENIRAWLFRVAHNQARNRQTRYDRRFGKPLDAQIEAIPDETSPEKAVLEQERFRQLEKAIAGLTDSERECLLLRSEGLRYREIGEILAIPTSTVGDMVDRAIKKLADKCDV
jgi:RNA polymerase sigma-70 factor, ECF subfamily